MIASLSSDDGPAAAERGASSPKRGVYFLANDSVLDIVIAFLNSFRIHNPTIPLCLIPFASDLDNISRLSEIYGFSIYRDEGILRRCDDIANTLFSQRPFWHRGHLRKLCAFEGPFDEFIYVDCDTVILSDVSFAFQFLGFADFVFAHSHDPGMKRWVWKESISTAGVLSEEQIALSASTGFICSRRKQLTLDETERRLPEVLSIGEHLEWSCLDQSFLNYLAVTSSNACTSLFKIRTDSGLWNIPLEQWAGESPLFRFRNPISPLSNDLLMVHWAGRWCAGRGDRVIYDCLARLGLRSRTPSIKLFMPRKRLWKYFRHYAYRDMLWTLGQGRAQRESRLTSRHAGQLNALNV